MQKSHQLKEPSPLDHIEMFVFPQGYCMDTHCKFHSHTLAQSSYFTSFGMIISFIFFSLIFPKSKFIGRNSDLLSRQAMMNLMPAGCGAPNSDGGKTLALVKIGAKTSVSRNHQTYWMGISGSQPVRDTSQYLNTSCTPSTHCLFLLACSCLVC
uniref:Uncharacterized protein n=1 Tax=Pipistrellus kuhlii TaxID=59472 RepID=A0A7J7ZJJ2_PIPKU|nr:hypothetical protein mPipKuh1_009641 [Pipistrellus kuhlii]